MSNIHLQTNIMVAINAIDSNEVEPIVDIEPHLYYISTRDKELGNLVYTLFVKATGKPVKTYHVRFGTYHTIQQVLFNPLPRSEREPEIDSIPGYTPLPLPNPLVIPGCY